MRLPRARARVCACACAVDSRRRERFRQVTTFQQAVQAMPLLTGDTKGVVEQRDGAVRVHPEVEVLVDEEIVSGTLTDDPEDVLEVVVNPAVSRCFADGVRFARRLVLRSGR